MNMRFVVNTHLLQKRFETWLAVLLPLFLIIESGIANAWVYSGGTFNLSDGRTWAALGRGLFFEVLTFCCFKLMRLLLGKKGWQSYLALVIVLNVGLWCIFVSAGNNLGWILSGKEMGGILASVGKIMPPLFYQVYQMGLGLLLPVAVGGIALVDIEHLVHDTIDTTADMNTRLLQLEESDMHKDVYKESQEAQRKEIKQEYDTIAAGRAKQFIGRVKAGDMSFGAKTSPAGAPGIGRADGRGLLPPSVAPQLPPGQVPVLPAQFGSAPVQSMGTTQNIVMPPASPPVSSKRWSGQ